MPENGLGQTLNQTVRIGSYKLVFCQTVRVYPGLMTNGYSCRLSTQQANTNSRSKNYFFTALVGFHAAASFLASAIWVSVILLDKAS